MVNFNKLKTLINQTEKASEKDKTQFYKQLIEIANNEINIKQTDVRKWF